jgi:hypothetical protein
MKQVNKEHSDPQLKEKMIMNFLHDRLILSTSEKGPEEKQAKKQAQSDMKYEKYEICHFVKTLLFYSP